jgi:hypothetical protein
MRCKMPAAPDARPRRRHLSILLLWGRTPGAKRRQQPLLLLRLWGPALAGRQPGTCSAAPAPPPRLHPYHGASAPTPGRE